MASRNPTHIFKILPPHEPIPHDTVRYSALDEKDGFIHLSTVAQVPRTCARFFTAVDAVTLLKIRYADVAAQIKWELAGSVDAPENYFPHVYGQLPASAIASVIRIVRQPSGEFGFDDEWWMK